MIAVAAVISPTEMSFQMFCCTWFCGQASRNTPEDGVVSTIDEWRSRGLEEWRSRGGAEEEWRSRG
jgi:hypothetical protein